MRRVMYLWLPRWPIDRLRSVRGGKIPARRLRRAPFATVADAAGRRLLAAVNPAAAAAGLAPGMPLADALSFLPGLATAPAEPAEDAAALRQAGGMVRPLQPVDRSRRARRGTDRDHRLGSSVGRGGGACRRSDDPARPPERRRPHRDRRHARAPPGRRPALPERSTSSRHSAAGRAARRSRSVAGRSPPPRPGDRPGLRRVGLKRVGDLYADAARRARPPFRRDRGAAARPGARAICRSRCRRLARRRPGGCG